MWLGSGSRDKANASFPPVSVESGRMPCKEREMAVLHKREDRKSWIDWAIEFMRHGLWLDETIMVQGPQSGADYLWGEANASTDEDDFKVVVAFTTGRKSRGDSR